MSERRVVTLHLFAVTVQVEGGEVRLLVEAESSTRLLQDTIAHLEGVQAAIQIHPVTLPQAEERPQ